MSAANNQGGGTAHDLFTSSRVIYRKYVKYEKYYLREICILLNSFYFYPDLQILHSSTMFIFSQNIMQGAGNKGSKINGNV